VSRTVRVTVWNEGRHEKKSPDVAKVYPDGIHGAIAEGLAGHAGLEIVKTATLDEDDGHGLSDEILASTDVLTWWGHMAHADVKDETVDLVRKHVLEGMGLIVLHSGHYSKIFRRLMGTGCGLKWREAGEMERLWVTHPGHPIAQGLGEYLELAHTEMYGELFDIPQPDDLVFISWFEGGDVFRSGCCWNRGAGKVFYFRPGHETFPIFYDSEILQVIANACRWAARPQAVAYALACPNIKKPLNPIPPKA